MKILKTISIVLLISLVLASVNSFAQQGEKATGKERPQGKERQAGAERPQQLAGAAGGPYCLVKATEQSAGKYTIQMDFGTEMEGSQKNIFQNEKDKEKIDKAMRENSLIDVLNILGIKGFDVVNSYAIADSKIVTHYYLLQMTRKGAGQRQAGMKAEELEKRRKDKESPSQAKPKQDE